MPRFKRVYIEITNCCNLTCDFCPSGNLQRSGRMMQTEEFKHLINQLQPYTKYLYFHLLGEPLLYPNLSEFFETSAEGGMEVNLTTNGMLIERMEPILMNAKTLRQINFSIHSFEANESEGEVQKYIASIVKFINRIREQRSVYCNLRLWNMDSQALQAKNTLNLKILKAIEKAFNLEFKLSDALQNSHQIKVKEGVFIHMAEKFEWPTLNREVISEEMFCHGLRDHFGIQVDGTVVPCCLDSEGNIPLGNVFQKNLDDILNSKRAKEIYHGFSRRQAVEELCKRCGYATRHAKKPR